jgi:hypothetical protein
MRFLGSPSVSTGADIAERGYADARNEPPDGLGVMPDSQSSNDVVLWFLCLSI